MSWHFLQEGAAASWEGSSLGGAPVALLKLMPTPAASCLQGRPTGASHRSPFGMTLERLTDAHGAGVLTWCLGGSPARTYLPPEQAKGLRDKRADFGPRWRGSLARCNPHSYSWRTRRSLLLGGLEEFCQTWPRWGMMHDGECWALRIPALPTSAKGSGLLPTPTAQDAKNSTLPPSQRDRDSLPGYLLRLGIAGQLNPVWSEWLMGWPLGWTGLEPLETGKFRTWLRLHGKPLPKKSNMDKTPAPNPFAVCLACDDTGVSSKGGLCHPCTVHGRLGARRYAVACRSGGVLNYIAGPTYNVNRLRQFEPPDDVVAYIVILGDNPKPIARWIDGRWQRKKPNKTT